MTPDSLHTRTDVPASLPPVDPEHSQASVPVAPAQAPQPMALSDVAISRYAIQARQLAVRYANDPYRLSEALGQLKAAYLTEQYHITTGQAGN